MSHPSPSAFAQLGVPHDVSARLAARGIIEPFPIQAATIADALAGRDVSGRAPTGSGKTIAFAIPLVTSVARGRSRRPRGLVLVPTRELASQVAREIRMLAGDKGPSVITVFGGVGFREQVERLRRGVDIVVACPGRLNDLLDQGHVQVDEVELVVLDEADRMADMGFLPQVRRVLANTPSDRQTLLFSATLDGDVDTLVRQYQADPVRHDVSGDDDARHSRHVFWRTERSDRVRVLADVVTATSPAIVFCRTKRGADRVATQLTRAGVSAAAIHGDRSQGQRDRALASFSAGHVQALVATDVAARGIHVDDVAIVVHFDPPATGKDYVHRSGRTGRAGRVGVVLSLVDDAQHRDAKTMQRQLGLQIGLDEIDVAELAGGAARRPRVPGQRTPAGRGGVAPGVGSTESDRGRRGRRYASAAARR